MKISVITVTYNSENSIGRTIESVLGQQIRTAADGPEIEYLIIDGNSTDGTIEKVESYREALEEKGISLRICSEPDQGIYDAMNKGIQLACGDVIGILNSDDWYEPDALQTVADTFADGQCELMFSHIWIHKRNGKSFVKKARLSRYETSRNWNHPTTFVRADVYKENPFKNWGIHDDYGFFLRMRRQNKKIVVVDKVLANFCIGGVSNRKDWKSAKKRIMDRYRYCYRVNGYSRLYMIECVMMEVVKMITG